MQNCNCASGSVKQPDESSGVPCALCSTCMNGESLADLLQYVYIRNLRTTYCKFLRIYQCNLITNGFLSDHAHALFFYLFFLVGEGKLFSMILVTGLNPAVGKLIIKVNVVGYNLTVLFNP